MTKIVEITQKARDAGMSYGQYVAVQWMKHQKRRRKKGRKKRPAGSNLTERKDNINTPQSYPKRRGLSR